MKQGGNLDPRLRPPFLFCLRGTHFLNILNIFFYISLSARARISKLIKVFFYFLKKNTNEDLLCVFQNDVVKESKVKIGDMTIALLPDNFFRAFHDENN